MGMTISEKILANKAGLPQVVAGELIRAQVDLVLANDITGPPVIGLLEKYNRGHVFDRRKIALVPDHFVPNKDIQAAEQAKILREFAQAEEIEHYFEVGQMGIEHCILPEKGLVKPGDLVLGADSHTCTYGALGAFSTGMGTTDIAAAMILGESWFKVPKSRRFVLKGKMLAPYLGGKEIILHIIGEIGVDGALYETMEYAGEGISLLSMDNRFTICNMAIEAGAKNGIIPADETTMAYGRGRGIRAGEFHYSDDDAEYVDELEIDLETLPLKVSFPHLQENTVDARDAGDVHLDQVVIGSCTNGRLDDLRAAREILKGKKVHPYVRLIVIPGSQQIYLDAIREGIISDLVEAGAAVGTPSCGPCFGGSMGILAKGEKVLSTTNRNFVGRMGPKESEIYLSGPAVAAASAVLGRIGHPEEVMGK